MTDEEFSFKTFHAIGILDFEVRFYKPNNWNGPRLSFGTLRKYDHGSKLAGINWFSNSWSLPLRKDWFQSPEFTKIFYSINKHNCFNEDFSRYLAEQLMILDDRLGW